MVPPPVLPLPPRGNLVSPAPPTPTNLTTSTTLKPTQQQLEELIATESWDEAVALAVTLGISPSFVHKTHYLSLPNPAPTSINTLLPLILDEASPTSATTTAAQALPNAETFPGNDEADQDLSAESSLNAEWVARATLQTARKATDPAVVAAAVQQGLAATSAWASASTTLAPLVTDPHGAAKLAALAEHDAVVREFAMVRTTLFEFGDRAQTWNQIWGHTIKAASAATSPAVGKKADHEKPTKVARELKDALFGSEGEEGEMDDAWGIEGGEDEEDGGLDGHDTDTDKAACDEVAVPPAPISLQTFLHSPLEESAFFLAASAEVEALLVLALRHTSTLWPIRFALLDAIPEWVDAADYRRLLPGLTESGRETIWQSSPWRPTRDWVEPAPPAPVFSSPEELATFYSKRVEVLASLGLISGALDLVMHSASLGVPHLDALGEELSLLGKLVYDRPPAPTSSEASQEVLTLEYWKFLTVEQAVSAYLAHSTPATIAVDLRQLVLPYLAVQESRLERAGTPDPYLQERLFHSYIFSLATSPAPSETLPLLVAIFEASIPTLPPSQRLIKSDEDLARLALACLYGSPATTGDALVAFGKIFECLPALDSASPLLSSSLPPPPLFSLPITPPSALTPSAIAESLSHVPPIGLATSLDTLDLHLSTAETFSRYSSPVPLSWFLTSHNDAGAQKSWATRLARTSAEGGDEVGAFESDDEWEGLCEDLLALLDGGEQAGMRKAFWLVSRVEMLRIFFAGLLAAGRFGLARSLFRPSSGAVLLEPGVEEELVIAASREFYDNAETGNLHKGEMKLAFDCLSAAPQTIAIKKERDFIEATSRLCSFKIYSQPGVPITPIEIRLSKDRLSFVSRLLSSAEDSYRHPDMILDLVSKLGYRDDPVAEIRALAMIADSAFQASDYVRGADTCDRMVAAVQALRKRKIVEDGAELAWQNCFQLGRHNGYRDVDRRMNLLGNALLLSPPDQIATLLPYWTALEDQVTTAPKAVVPDASTSTFAKATAFLPAFVGGIAPAIERRIPSPAAAPVRPPQPLPTPPPAPQPQPQYRQQQPPQPPRQPQPPQPPRQQQQYSQPHPPRQQQYSQPPPPPRQQQFSQPPPPQPYLQSPQRQHYSQQQQQSPTQRHRQAAQAPQQFQQQQQQQPYHRQHPPPPPPPGPRPPQNGRSEGIGSAIGNRFTAGVGWLIGADEQAMEGR